MSSKLFASIYTVHTLTPLINSNHALINRNHILLVLRFFLLICIFIFGFRFAFSLILTPTITLEIIVLSNLWLTWLIVNATMSSKLFGSIYAFHTLTALINSNHIINLSTALINIFNILTALIIIKTRNNCF